MKKITKTLMIFAVCSLLFTSLGAVVLAKPTHNQNNYNSRRCYRRIFFSRLKGENEVPPVETKAFGFAKFVLSKDYQTLYYLLVVARIENVTQAHIHLGMADENGPVVVWLYPDTPPPMLIPGKFNGVLAKGKITATDLVGPLEGMSIKNLLLEIKTKNTYVNVHTEQNAPGEIRGQIFKIN